MSTTIDGSADVLASVQAAFGFLEERGLRRTEAFVATPTRWQVTYADREHEVAVHRDPDDLRIHVTVDGRDLRTTVVDLAHLEGLLSPAEQVRLAHLGQLTARRDLRATLDDHAALLRRHADQLLTGQAAASS